MLTAIKLLHTVIWAILAGSIVVLPFAGVLRRFRWAAILTGLVVLECIVLAVNGGRCPLTDWAALFTDSHAKSVNPAALHVHIVSALTDALGNII